MSAFFSRAKDQLTASLMHSLCAACSWRQSLCSGAAPWYYICFPREHTLIVGLLSITEPEISSFSRGDSVSKAGHLIFISLFYCKHKSVFTSEDGRHHLCCPTLCWTQDLEVRWIDGKMKASPFLLQFYPSTVSLFCTEHWHPYYALTDKLENNTINSQWHLKLAI